MALALFRSRTAQRSRPWFLPGSVTVAFVVLAVALLWVDRRLLDSGETGSALGFGGGANAASAILSTIAGSLITVAGLAFSLTIVTVQLVSAQFTPRAVGHFLKDRFNQVTVGFFAGVFAYCVLVLRSIRGPDESSSGAGFVPGVSVNVAILLGVISVQLLVVFIYRVGRSVDVADIATDLGRKSRRSLDERYPEPFGFESPERAEDLLASWRAAGRPELIRSGQSGYVEEVQLARVTKLGGDARVHLLVCPGDFVTERTVVAEVWAEQRPDDTALAEAFSVTSQRSMRQDTEFGLRQLTDIALRAISPGVNDPTTAVMCIGHLQNALEQLVTRDLSPSVVRRNGVTLMLRRRDFAEYVQNSVLEIGRYATGDGRVAGVLLGLLEGVGTAAVDSRAIGALPVLRAAIEAVSQPALADARTELDRAALHRRVRAAEAAVTGSAEFTAPAAAPR